MADSNFFLEFLGKSSDSSRKQIFRDIKEFFSNLIVQMYVVCTHYNRLIGTILLTTRNITLFKEDSGHWSSTVFSFHHAKPYLKRRYTNMKGFASRGANYFSFIVDAFSEGRQNNLLRAASLESLCIPLNVPRIYNM